MAGIGRAAARGLGAASATAVVAMGFVFALGGGEGSGLPASNTFLVFETPTPPAATGSVTRTVMEDVATAMPSPTAEVASATPAGPAPVATTADARAAPPTPVPAVATQAPAIELPKYRDTQVLALAADARLPSGYTFRECMELPPRGEGWPASVHLYWEGAGRWLVETHYSEVQVVFDEASGTFSVRNFAPVNEACLRR